MKVSFATISAVITASFIPAVKGDFDLYQVISVATINKSWVWFWHVGNGHQTCSMLDAGMWLQQPDVSGSKRGVRCSGNGCQYGEPIVEIDVLEMHFKNHPLRHWTIYKDRGYDLIGLNGENYGHCTPTHGPENGDFNCHTRLGVKRGGHLKFRCKSKYNAADLKKGE